MFSLQLARRDRASQPQAMSSKPVLSHADKIAAAKRKAAEMKAAAEAKKAAREQQEREQGGGASSTATAESAAAADSSAAFRFQPGEHTLILIDWDDTLFPTSAWKDRVHDGATDQLSSRKVEALSATIVEFVSTLQRHGEVKIVTHGTSGWFELSSKVLAPEAKALLDSLDHRYRDSKGGKYTKKKPHGVKYTTNIGVEVDDWGEWYKTDMFFEFISEKRQPVKWDETHLPPTVVLPTQVLIIGDGHAEKRSYDEHGNQAQAYASRPGHAAVANVGLKGLFLKEKPSYDELLQQLRWATARVASAFLPPSDSRTMMWDLTGYPEWVCALKAGANAYQPIDRGAIVAQPGGGASVPPAAAAAAAAQEEERALQEAIMMSLRDREGGGS